MEGSEIDLVSIIIPVYNRGNLIGETLDSILNQTYQNWECIVVDDGSTDNTPQIVNKYCERDNRIKYYTRPNSYIKGGSGARNYGFKLSAGQYINWFDSDDIMAPNKLEMDIRAIKSGEFDFTISHSDFFGDVEKIKKKYWNLELWSNDGLNDFIQKKIGWGVNTPLWKKEVLKDNNLSFDESLKSGQDYLYHIQALSNNLKPCVINEILVSQRVHNNKIENRVDKSGSKVVIYLYLLHNRMVLGINLQTYRFLINSSIYVVSMLYRAKKTKAAISFSKQLMKFRLNLKDFHRLIKFFIFGSIFKLTNKGYSFLR